jgi:hypothetical protein
MMCHIGGETVSDGRIEYRGSAFDTYRMRRSATSWCAWPRAATNAISGRETTVQPRKGLIQSSVAQG